MTRKFAPSLLVLLLGTPACEEGKSVPLSEVAGTQSDGLQDADGDGFTDDEDCNDRDATVQPSAMELCNGIDDNCDGQVDEGVRTTYYSDRDSDGFGDAASGEDACEQPAGTSTNNLDCDDTDASVFPAAIEVCDGIDNNCDNAVDEGVGLLAFADRDNDGFGDPGESSQVCTLPAGFVSDATDCNDSDANVHPGAVELCNERDDDCDEIVDEGVRNTYFVDLDNDGWGGLGATTEACAQPAGYASVAGDCDDSAPLINPDAVELCNSQDDDCDGTTDESDAIDAATLYADADADGYGNPAVTQRSCIALAGFVSHATDCDDGASQVHPGATESCNGIDDDCDSLTDDNDPSLLLSSTSYWYADSDRDGFGNPSLATQSCIAPTGYVANSSDCDDASVAVNPSALEVCNLIDDDCDGDVDDNDSSVDASTGTPFYVDADRDGYGDAARSAWSCVAPSGYVADATDCDDAAIAIHPGASEVCNGIDDDCDSAIDDADTSLDLATRTPWYPDDDSDGYGVDADMVMACDAPSGYVADGGDCDDTRSDYAPDAALGCDGEDYNCDGIVDADGDADGFADAACGGDDCDDTDDSIYPDPLTGDCALGTTCADILDAGRSSVDGIHIIDPDGVGTGLDPFAVYCDMTTDGGGWTEIPYAADLNFQRWFTSGDYWQWLPSDFTFDLSDSEIAAIQALSAEGAQDYYGLCNHVIHYYYNDGVTYGYAFGFEFFDGSRTPYGSASYAPYNISVIQDGCRQNGGEGGAVSLSTIFRIDSVDVPIRNVLCRDCGDSGEYFGSSLTSHSAWLR